MGCFCREALQALRPRAEPEALPVQSSKPDEPPDPLIPAVSDWLAARWLPSPAWHPDADWIATEVVDPPMEPQAMATLLGLFQARQACMDGLGLDPTDPDQGRKLARIVGTLNRRTAELSFVEQDDRPWEQVALLNDQADAVREAATQGAFEPTPQDDAPPIGPWRVLLGKLRAIAPLIAIAQWQDVDWADPEAAQALAETVRTLRRVVLPPLDNPLLVMRVIARTSALARLKKSLGADPQPVPFDRVARAVARKVDAARQLLPNAVQVRDGRLDGMPTTQPNPSLLLNPEMIAQARKITPEAADRLRWHVPPDAALDLLTSAAPVAALAKLLRPLGPDPVRSSPCGPQCDAGAVGRALAA